MTALTDAQIGVLVDPISNAFINAKAEFWRVCSEEVVGLRNEVAEGPFSQEVQSVLSFLNANEQAAPILGRMLLSRPGNRALREAIRQVHPDALAVVSELRFNVEAQIEATLSGSQARAVRDSLDQIDVMMKAVTAYKAIHDALHVLQPLSQLFRGAAGTKARWPELRLSLVQVQQQLANIDKAATELQALGRNQRLSFRCEIVESLELLNSALDSRVEYEVRDAASQMTSDVEEGLDTVDVMMLAAVEEASAPVCMAIKFLDPLIDGTKGTQFGCLISSYVEFARQVSEELAAAIEEHGRWQQLDRKFDLLQRVVVENQPGAPGEIDSVWRLASRQLDSLCCGAPPPPWAASIVDLLCAARKELVPPISPPVADQVRDRISALISNGRSRFMEVDRALLDWLSQSASRQPELISLLKGNEHGTTP